MLHYPFNLHKPTDHEGQCIVIAQSVSRSRTHRESTSDNWMHRTCAFSCRERLSPLKDGDRRSVSHPNHNPQPHSVVGNYGHFLGGHSGAVQFWLLDLLRILPRSPEAESECVLWPMFTAIPCVPGVGGHTPCTTPAPFGTRPAASTSTHVLSAVWLSRCGSNALRRLLMSSRTMQYQWSGSLANGTSACGRSTTRSRGRTLRVRYSVNRRHQHGRYHRNASRPFWKKARLQTVDCKATGGGIHTECRRGHCHPRLLQVLMVDEVRSPPATHRDPTSRYQSTFYSR